MYNGSKLDEIKAGVSMFSYLQFAYLQDRQNAGNDWYNFERIENLPNDLKYQIEPSSPIVFKEAPGQQAFMRIELDIDIVLSVYDPDEMFYLNPVRWDNVKNDLSKGWCYCPWIYFKDEEAQLMDGRHRIAALKKYTTVKYIPVVVRNEDVKDVLNYLQNKFSLGRKYLKGS
ncbi:hypothetical protein [Pseudoalteromonas galatheae]|uniref:hypothetical protein n=1 Tax=Pseudoalteromonas galatheae TaxID=579562 RepID=UPI0030D4C285